MTNDETIDRNYRAFVRQLPDLMDTHAGQFALMRNEVPVEFFDSEDAAITAGEARFADDSFSIQEVTRRSVDLGFFSHALDLRIH